MFDGYRRHRNLPQQDADRLSDFLLVRGMNNLKRKQESAVAAPEALFEKLLIAKQASDLHTCNFTQHILMDFLDHNSLEDHLNTIRTAYGAQCQAMVAAIEREFPTGVTCTRPEGGMFLWAWLPDQLSALKLFEEAVERKVVFVPGEPFYTGRVRSSAFRLNFSCVDQPLIDAGIGRLAEAIAAISSA